MSVRRKALPADAAYQFQSRFPEALVSLRQHEGRYVEDNISAKSWLQPNGSQMFHPADTNINATPTLHYVVHKTPEVSTEKQSQDSLSTSLTNDECTTKNKAAANQPVASLDSPRESPSEIDNDPVLNFDLTSSTLHIEQPSLQGSKTTRKAKVASALQDASIFLGGLIKHPTQSTKHFTILRHSHGLVYYKGPATSIAITVFSDRPLPSNRRYWLQMKGWSGDTGMRAKAFLRTNGSWINVTPAKKALATDLSSVDERAWQRDIRKFQDKASKELKKHTVRETAVIRVPSDAVDGYFRVVLTGANDRSPLCPSPIFRVASTSISAGSIKGASLSTLPIELTVNILQYAARTVTSNFVAPFAETARAQILSAMPSAVSSYGQTAYYMSGLQDHINTLEERYDERRDLIIEESRDVGNHYVPMTRPEIVGDDAGPETPFPIHLNGSIVPGSGTGLREVGMPTANLDNVAPDVLAKLDGVYFGWVFVTPKDEKQQRDLHSEWRQAIITAASGHATNSVAVKKVVRAYLLHNFGEHQFFNAKMSLVLMGHLQPIIPFADKEAFFTETMRDIEITRSSLERDQWQAETTLRRTKTIRSQRSFTERYVDGRMAVQRRVDKVPVHLLGVRSDSFGMNDRAMYGNGGLYMKRDDA